MPVETREETVELLTYVWGPPDPNPPFQRSGNWAIYPYPLLDDIREEARPVRYRVLVVENDYLRVMVLPELGGRIFSAFDKVAGEEIFYRNNVIKPGLIALRGAWISGGVEWNFPRGHTVTTVSPVDAHAVEEEDGSATIWVGNVEQIYRMAWAVGIRLRPDARLIETEIILSNRTALPHPYYFWVNAAVPAHDDMRLIYPGAHAFTWRDAAIPWPIHEGRDLSYYRAFESANDVFIVDSLEDFFGVYYEDRDFGIVHVANVHDSSGKKMFTWGTADHGKVWSAALSDSDGPYCEVQSGRFVHQGVWRQMPPHFTEHWREWWYAVKGTGGFSWANREAAVRLARTDGGVECGVLVTRPQHRAVVRAAAGQVTVYEERADLIPERPARVHIPLDGRLGQEVVTLTLLDGAGREIIRYTEAQSPRTIALREEPKRSQETPGDLLSRALRAEESGEFDRARDLYESAVKLDPACVQATIALGRLDVEGRADAAVERLTAAATAAPESDQAAYYLGLALCRAGREDKAEVELSRAASRPEFAHAARVQLGLLAMRKRQWSKASELLRAAAQRQPEDTRSQAMLAAALRHHGQPKDAEREASALCDAYPADRLALAEAHFCAVALDRPRVAVRLLRRLREAIPDDADPWLELAFDYFAAGLFEEASDLLSWAVERIAPVRSCPLVHYVLAYCWKQLDRDTEAAAARRRGAGLSAQYVFPHHWELEAVLRWALGEESADAAAHYYLGCMFYSQARRDEALVEWEAALAGMDDFSVLRRSLAMGYGRVRGDLARAERELREAIRLDPTDVRLYLELNSVLQERGCGPEERLSVLDSAPGEVARRGTIAAQKIMCCMELERWDRAISLLTSHTFHRWEMEFRMRSIYLQAYLGRGVARFDRGDLAGAREDFEAALEYPMNLRIGRPPRPANARARWCAAIACEALGDTTAATAHWEEAAAESYHHPGKELAIYRALSLKRLGRMEEAEAVLAESVKVGRQCADLAPDDGTAQYSLGLVLKAMGREEEARVALERAVELEPGLRRTERLLQTDVVL